MPTSRQSNRIDTLELKARIFKKLGHQKADKYFFLLTKLFSLKIKRIDFEKVCIGIIGRENLPLHNRLIESIIKNACVAKSPPFRRSRVDSSKNAKMGNGGNQRSSPQSVGKGMSPLYPCQGRSSNLRKQKLRDISSPIDSTGKTQSTVWDGSVRRMQEQQSATELLSLGSRPLGEVVSVEDGEEVEQMMGSPSVQSRSPVRPPLGISTNVVGARKALLSSSITSFCPAVCHNNYELPDTRFLRMRLERKLAAEGLNISMDCANALNHGLDAFLKCLIRPCIELAGSKHGVQQLKQANGWPQPFVNGMMSETHILKSGTPISASLSDFRVAMELNPQVFGDDWPSQLEKICLRSSVD
ncbi:hypothetical protein Syun_014657 [Stephania yunnanensis]|uniref:Transcriptional coactivator Hfi1/Transcriptional adapter 1 n=1 Tax=Stephania yunnanensis TaxID=152371 RepID=A0AAP0JJY8_9MAGN